MEGKEKYFLVTRGRARKGLSRGCVCRVEAETHAGEILCSVYSGGGGVTAKSGGVVTRGDTCPLTRHQAQLLLLVSSAGRRVELLRNPPLFGAICDLAHGDLVVVRHKQGLRPCVVRNLVQVGRREDADDMVMLGFELELLDPDQKVTSKKAAPLPVFSAADIIQVAAGYASATRPLLRDGHSLRLNKKAVSRINSTPAMCSRNSLQRTSIQRTPQIQKLADCTLEVGSMVELSSGSNVVLYGVIKWIGTPEGKKGEWAGIELDCETNGCTDGTIGTQRFFTCKGKRALFVPLGLCMPDSRFHSPSPTEETPEILGPDSVPQLEEDGENVPPLSESEARAMLEGKMKGIQGHFNSCYLDATLFSLFSTSMALDSAFDGPAKTEGGTLLKRNIVNRLRRKGFVPAKCVMNFRKQLGCETFVTEEKDPEEFISILLKDILDMKPLLKIRSSRDTRTSEGAYTYQIILEKNEVEPCPSVQQLLETSFMSCDLKFEEVPSCLMIQMPRFGKKFKMFPFIIPTTDLDITDLLQNAPRECFICGQLAQYECGQCFKDSKLQPGKVKQYCSICNKQVHTHPSRQGHEPCITAVPEELSTGGRVSRHRMQLFAVLCIHTSHYVSFVKYGPGSRSWLFYDSMADRFGDDKTGYNIPEVRACPEVGDFLSLPPEEQARVDLSQASELVRRLLCDSFMCLYQIVQQ
ncbi:ubiquitin carboxyl-terminal hydrolase CYLD [Denticeps clupeoides]|uniref:ubiquitinyl hydrolase 1 n=1 Tax=Denticeps clupeoides TaxID=299321 RepID=A0AAY4CY38_9TELE|nr:ubiquitin carboxyl-terminal hydrolase CYLD-like [Denticeps clupeoides]